MQSPTQQPTVQFGGVPVAVDRLNIAPAGAEPDTDQLTAATVRKMTAAIQAAAGHPLVVRAVHDAIGSATGAPVDWSDCTAVALAVWEWVRSHVRFVPDDDVLRAQLGMPAELELLITPPVLLSMESPAGDCDDFSMLAGAMLLSAGIPAVEVVTVKGEPQRPGRWSHVYLSAQCGPGLQPLTFDASHGEWIGWEAPYHFGRRGWGWITAAPAARNEHTRRTAAKGAQMHGLGLFGAPQQQTPGYYPQQVAQTSPWGAVSVNPSPWGGAYGGYRAPSMLNIWDGGIYAYGSNPNQPIRTDLAPRCNPWIDGDCDGLGGLAGTGGFDWGQFSQQLMTGTFDVIKQVTQKHGQYIQPGAAGSTISTGVPGAAPYPGGGITFQTPIGGGSVGTGLDTGSVLVLGALGLGLVLLLKR